MNPLPRRTDRRRFAALGLGLAGGLLALRVATTWAEPDAASAKPPGLGPDRVLEWQGTASCATSACHGGAGPEGDDRSAYTIWKGLDPHSRSFSVLTEAESAEIETALAAATGQAPLAAVSDARCLRCHVHPDVETAPLASQGLRQLGVSCEGCHGPAQEWLEPHKRLEDWQKRTAAEKASKGLKPLGDLTVQAELCAGCHVGGPGREVDHDLIAAGHPRLNFALSTFLDALPKHWSTAATKGGRHDDEALVWSIGQIVSARAALELLAARARDAKAGARPWPEFTEYACDSCHHNLADPSWSQPGGPGVPLWGTWYLPGLAHLAQRIPGMTPEEWEQPYQALRRLMGKPAPDPGEVEALASGLARWLGGRLEPPLRGARFDRRALVQLLDSRLAGAEERRVTSWDEAAQLAIFVQALDRALQDLGRPDDPEARAALHAMIRAIEEPSRRATAVDPDRPTDQNRFHEAADRFRKRLNP
jgi:hypothetical protein